MYIDVHTFQYILSSFATLLMFWFGVQRVAFTQTLSFESFDSNETQMARDAEGDDYFVKSSQNVCMAQELHGDIPLSLALTKRVTNLQQM